MAGAVLFREGDDRPLTIASAEAVADGPGWRIRFREVADPRRAPTRCAAPTSRSVVRPEEDLAAGQLLLARGHRRDRPRRRRRRARHGRATSTASARPRSSSVSGGPFGDFDLPAVRAFIRIFAPRRGEIVVDAESLDLRAPRSRTPDPDRPKAPAPPDRRRKASRRRPPSDAPAAGRPRSRHDPRDRHPDPVPGDGRRTARREHPRPDPGAGPRDRSASTTCASGASAGTGRVDDAPYGGGAGMILRPEPVAAALDALRRPDSTVILLDPVGEVFRQARAADLADAIAPRLRLPALRGRRRADPLAGRPRAVDRRLRPDRRRAAGAGRHRRRHPPAAGRHRGGLDRRGVVRRRAARVPAVHPPAGLPRRWTCRRS